jgi:hypothetical protein
MDSSPPLVTEVVTNDETPGGIQDHQWDTKRPAEYKITGGIRNARWDTRTPVGSRVPLENRCRTKTPAGSADHIG